MVGMAEMADMGAIEKNSGGEASDLRSKRWFSRPGRGMMISISRPRCGAYVRHLAALLALAVLWGCATNPTEIAHTVVITKVRPDQAHPVQLGEDYPAESKLLHEEGVCKVKLTVTADGAVRDVSLTKSTGYPRLDQACSEAFVHGGLLPATRDGKPITTTLEIPITWKLAATPSQAAH
jgi:TonB family protein